MSITRSLISILPPSKHSNFITYLETRTKRLDTKNSILFKALLLGTSHELKVQMGSNAYNVLNKRLSDRLIDFISNTLLKEEVSEENSILKLILVARKLFTYNSTIYAFKLLKKAENKALQLGEHTLLNEIYHTSIQYSHLVTHTEQSMVFSKYENNQVNLLNQERINMANAVVRKAFIESESHQTKINLKEFIENTYLSFGITQSQSFTFKSLYQLVEIIDFNSTHSKSFHDIDLFFIEKLNQLKNTPLDSEKHLLYHIDLVFLISNIYFRKKQFKLCLLSLEDMHIQMQRYSNKYYSLRQINYYTLKALALNYSNNHTQALSFITNLITSKGLKKQNLQNPILILVLIHFQQGRLAEANTELIKLNKSDNWYINELGVDWLLHKKYIEILLHIELGNTDYADSRILSLTRQYGSILKELTNFQVVPFLKLIKIYYNNPKEIKAESFKQKIESTLKWKPTYQEDVFLISFYAWLKSKIDQKPLYEVTLELVNRTE